MWICNYQHINDIIIRAQKRSLLILGAFVSHNVSLLVCAFIVYVCLPNIGIYSVVWWSHTIHDINCTECVKRRFTKSLAGSSNYSYIEWVRPLQLPTLELRRLHFDFVWCYKILFGHTDVEPDQFFNYSLLELLVIIIIIKCKLT